MQLAPFASRESFQALRQHSGVLPAFLAPCTVPPVADLDRITSRRKTHARSLRKLPQVRIFSLEKDASSRLTHLPPDPCLRIEIQCCFSTLPWLEARTCCPKIIPFHKKIYPNMIPNALVQCWYKKARLSIPPKSVPCILTCCFQPHHIGLPIFLLVHYPLSAHSEYWKRVKFP